MEPAAITLNACDCVVGAIINPKTQLANKVHLSPYERTMSVLERTLRRFREQAHVLQGNSKARLQGLLIGGDNRESEPNAALLLQEMHAVYRNIADSYGMDYSVIAGRNNFRFGVDVISDAKANSYYIHLREDPNPYRESFEISSASELAWAYKQRRLARDHKIIIGGENASDEFRRIATM